jgi:hypothetical protein
MRKHDRQNVNVQHVTQWFRYVLAWYLHAHIYIPLMESQWMCTEDSEDTDIDTLGNATICQTAYGLYTFAQKTYTSPKNSKTVKNTKPQTRNPCSANPYEDLIDQCLQFWKNYTYDKNNNKIRFDQFPFSMEDDPVKTIYEEALVYFRTHMDRLHLPKNIATIVLLCDPSPSSIERSFASALKLVALI